MQPWKSENKAGRDRRFHACHVDCGAEPTQAPAYPFTPTFGDFALPVAAAKTVVCSVDIDLFVYSLIDVFLYILYNKKAVRSRRSNVEKGRMI